MIRFYSASDLSARIGDMIAKLGLKHVDPSRVVCVRSTGSAAHRTVARCYALPRIWQGALGLKPHYIIEVISEAFEKLPRNEQDKVLIHELLHIPHSFGGGFRHHATHVNRKAVEAAYEDYRAKL